MMTVIRLYEFLFIYSEDSFLLTNAKIISKEKSAFTAGIYLPTSLKYHVFA